MTYSLDMREAALSFIKNGGSKVEACHLYGCSRDTLYRWLRMDDLRPKAHGSRNRIIDKKALRKHVEEHPDMFLHERAELFGVGVSGMHYALKRLGIVKKRARV